MQMKKKKTKVIGVYQVILKNIAKVTNNKLLLRTQINIFKKIKNRILTLIGMMMRIKLIMTVFIVKGRIFARFLLNLTLIIMMSLKKFGTD